jgi:phosphoserine aminotransferase
MSRPLPMDLFGLIYAGAQKNLGPAGATMVIIRDDLLERCPDDLPAYLNYKTHVEKNSLYNTPPVLSIYALMLVLEWIQSEGGVKKMSERCNQKSSLIYNAIDSSDGFYKCNVCTEFRSSMNVAFRLPSESLEGKFIKEAENKGMIGLKGHRSVGGIRASLYNAVELSWVEALIEFMADFRKNNGER